MNRIYFTRCDSAGKFPDGRVKLDVYFKDSAGNTYVWTPDWERGTRQFFLEAYRIESLNKPGSQERERFRQVAQEVLDEEERRDSAINFKLVAVKLADGLKNAASFNAITRAASALFPFQVAPHPLPGVTSEKWQTIYDCVMTLAEQPIAEQKKLRLLRGFVFALTPEGSVDTKLLEDLGKGS